MAGVDECACCAASPKVRDGCGGCADSDAAPCAHCAGTWTGTCTSDCVLPTWTEAAAQSGQGAACPVAPSCPSGEGTCPRFSTGGFVGLLCGIICVLLAGMWMARLEIVACRSDKQRKKEQREARNQRAEEHARREAEQAKADAKADAPRITLVVKELTGKAIEVSTLSSLHTVAELKETVAAATGGEAARLRLVFKNVPLEDESTLGSCGVGEGSEVNAVAKAAAQEEELLPQAVP